MKKLKKLIAVAMCGLITLTCTACAGGGGAGGGNLPKHDPDETTIITLYVGGGGFGSDTFEEQSERFYESVKDKEYEPGKKGAYVDVQVAPDSGSIALSEALLAKGYHLISGGSYWKSLQSCIEEGYAANLDSIMRTTIPGENKTIIDKIEETQRWTYAIDSDTTADGLEYYAFPGVDAYGGLTYDKDMFDLRGYYIASPLADINVPEEGKEKVYCSILNEFYYFTNDAALKSVGPDGISGNEDDGLPSSLYELIALCEKIRGDGIAPFAYTKAYSWYINYFADALYASLLGKDNASAINNFESDGIDIVVGFTDEDLFPGAPELGVKVPKTVKIDIDESCGYYVTHSLAKYYVYAFFQLMETQSWYKSTGTKSHLEVQSDFLFGKKDATRSAAMLVECSYWYNESRIRGTFTDYEISYPGDQREIRWMSLPVNIKTSVTGQDGSVNTGFNTESTKGSSMVLASSGDGYVALNGRYKNDPVVMEVVKDYMLFIFSDAELSKFTVASRYHRSVEYDVNPADYANDNSYTKAYFELTKNATVAYAAGDSDVYRNDPIRFVRGGNSGFFATTASYGTAIRESLSAKGILGCFKEKLMTQDDWKKYYGAGQGTVVPGFREVNGQKVVFNG